MYTRIQRVYMYRIYVYSVYICIQCIHVYSVYIYVYSVYMYTACIYVPAARDRLLDALLGVLMEVDEVVEEVAPVGLLEHDPQLDLALVVSAGRRARI